MHSIENYTAIESLIYKKYWIVEKMHNNMARILYNVWFKSFKKYVNDKEVEENRKIKSNKESGKMIDHFCNS